MKRLSPILLSVIAYLGLPVCAAAHTPADSIYPRILQHSSPITALDCHTWLNPAMKQWQWSSSLSSVAASYRHTSQSRAIDPQLGSGAHLWGFDARSYMKHKSSTLWGAASYANGRIRHKQWCEAVDIDLIYPYYPATQRGGSMNVEQYAFSGGYADHSGRWAWGAALGYDAGLYYRPVDPRPKDVTGKLDISAGAAYAIGSYRVGLGFDFMKYKQSVSIAFISEMGEDKIYHTTGMGTHYVRFAGNGATTYYNGHRYGAQLSLMPASRVGFTANIHVSRFQFSSILADLNKLPLCGAWHNDMLLQTGYVNNNWGVTANFHIYKRHGHENIFGDATGSIYPQIGSSLTYADNAYKAWLQGAWQTVNINGLSFRTTAQAYYRHRCELYFSPGRQSLTDNAGGKISANASVSLSHGWHIALGLDWECQTPVNNSLTLREADSPATEAQLLDIERVRHHYSSINHNTATARLNVTRSINRKYALQLSGELSRTSYSDNTRQQYGMASLAFIF